MNATEIQAKLDKFHERMKACGPYPQTGHDVIQLTVVELLGECALQLAAINERENRKLAK
jgi:hypothetical protein